MGKAERAKGATLDERIAVAKERKRLERIESKSKWEAQEVERAVAGAKSDGERALSGHAINRDRPRNVGMSSAFSRSYGGRSSRGMLALAAAMAMIGSIDLDPPRR